MQEAEHLRRLPPALLLQRRGVPSDEAAHCVRPTGPQRVHSVARDDKEDFGGRRHLPQGEQHASSPTNREEA